MNHKRKRPKSRRAGCLLCKPYKMQGACPRHINMRWSDRRGAEGAREQIKCEVGNDTGTP